MGTVRKPAVAGFFYPDDPERLRADVRRYLAETRQGHHAGGTPKAIIAPHAGYIYSGPIAAAAYDRLLPARGRIRRVVLMGPNHTVPLRGMAVCPADVFATPAGNVPVDREAADRILGLRGVAMVDLAHAREHSLEVHLPFLLEVLGEFRLVPIVVGESAAGDVGAVLDELWDGPETLIVVSSDLSHYLDYDSARRLDRATTGAIEALRYEDIDVDQACGRNPIRGLIWTARRRGMAVRTLDLRNSGDTAGPRNRVVGYGAYAFTE